MRRLRIIGGVGAAALLLVSLSPGRHADLRVLMHRPDDLAPQRVQAAFDLGLVGLSVLVTWSRQLRP
jgi:hypothetical protein